MGEYVEKVVNYAANNDNIRILPIPNEPEPEYIPEAADDLILHNYFIPPAAAAPVAPEAAVATAATAAAAALTNESNDDESTVSIDESTVSVVINENERMFKDFEDSSADDKSIDKDDPDAWQLMILDETDENDNDPNVWSFNNPNVEVVLTAVNDLTIDCREDDDDAEDFFR